MRQASCYKRRKNKKQNEEEIIDLRYVWQCFFYLFFVYKLIKARSLMFLNALARYVAQWHSSLVYIF